MTMYLYITMVSWFNKVQEIVVFLTCSIKTYQATNTAGLYNNGIVSDPVLSPRRWRIGVEGRVPETCNAKPCDERKVLQKDLLPQLQGDPYSAVLSAPE